MKRKALFGILILAVAGLFSCQHDPAGITLDDNLTASLAEVIGTQVGVSTLGTEMATAVEKFNGTSPAFPMPGTGIPPAGFGLPGWHFSEMDHMKFGIPHIDSCVTVTVSSSAYPREIVIEFIKGCSAHKHSRSGKVIIDLSDTITKKGAVQTIRYEDFYIDTIKVDYTATRKNLGKNESGNWVIEETSIQTITKGEDVAVRTNNEIKEWISGFETAGRADNSFYVTGSGKIEVNGTEQYSRKITTPLLFDSACEFIKSGIVELIRDGNISIINYGDGTCDDVATVTTDGTTVEINLHRKGFGHNNGFGHKFKGFGGHHRGKH